jgi:hypothetical protein
MPCSKAIVAPAPRRQSRGRLARAIQLREYRPGKLSKTICAIWLLLLLCSFAVAQSTPHDRAYWQAIAKNKYAVPEHESADKLAHELSALLASPDPELRDDLAYSILARWIYRPNILTTATLESLTEEWRANLKSGIGETGTNSVLQRSFSALLLSSIAYKEAKDPFLGEARYHQFFADALHYFQSERDLRGYDAKLGWIHANAHTADLLHELASSPLATKEELNQVLAAIASRLSSAPEVYIQGEQDRMAVAVIAVVRKPTVDLESFSAWLDRMNEEDKTIWVNPLTPEILARYQNHGYFLQALSVQLELEPEFSRITDFNHRVLEVLRKRAE